MKTLVPPLVDSLASDAAAKGYNPTTFNTASDVENALRHLDGGGAPSENKGFTEPSPDLEMSKELSDAKERAQAWIESNGYSGNAYGDGSRATPGEVDYDNLQAFKPYKK